MTFTPTEPYQLQLILVMLVLLGTVIIIRSFLKTNGGYIKCQQCQKKLSIVQVHFRSKPFCSLNCVEAYDSFLGSLVLRRFRNDTGGAVLVEDALLYAAALVVTGGLVKHSYHILWLIFHHAQQYAGCSAPPGGC